MRATMPCPSDLALEQYVLGELRPSQSHVGDHVATCATCRSKLAEKAADSVAFASLPGAAEIKSTLSSRVFTLPAPTASTREPLAPTIPGPTPPVSAPSIEALDPSRRRIVAALGFAAAIAIAFLLTLRPPSSITPVTPTGPTAAPSAHPNAVEDETAVMRVQREWMEAIRDKDAAALDRILADDYVYTDSRGGVSNKADSLRDARSGRGRLTAFQTTDEKAHIFGDVAVVTGHLRVEGVAGSGQTYDAEVRFTDILARIDGQWRAVAAHASKATAR